MGAWSVSRHVILAIGMFIVLDADVFATETNTTPPAPVTQNDKRFGPGSDRGLDVPDARTDRPLKIRNIRLEPDPDADVSPSSLLKFDLLNAGTIGLTNIVLEVSILRARQENESDSPGRVLVRPFTIRERVVLEAGYSMEYQVHFRNLPAGGGCEARVAVVSVESLAGSPSR